MVRSTLTLEEECERDPGGAGKSRRFVSTRSAVLLVGVFVLLFFIATPLWDAARLLRDPSITFFLGRMLPLWTVASCLSTLVIFVVAIFVLFSRERDSVRVECSLLLIVTAVLGLLALLMITVGRSLTEDSLSVSKEILEDCRDGPRTRPLYLHSATLQQLRSGPLCSWQTTIEACFGFQARPVLTDVLKEMEAAYGCAGFCHTVPAVASLGANQTSSAAAASAGPGSRRGLLPRALAALPGLPVRRRGSPKFQAHVHSALEAVGGPIVPAASADLEQGRSPQHFESLFSQKRTSITCEGAAARSLRFQGAAVGGLVFYSGVWLVASIAVMNFLAFSRLGPPGHDDV